MKILVTGGSGQVGKELKQILPMAMYISSDNCDLTDEQSVKLLMINNQFDIVIHLAARVGGIMDNINRPADYFVDNIMMNTNILKWSHLTNVPRFIGILSTCIFPDIAPLYPMKEDVLHQGPPTKTNFSYGYAKRCLAVQIDAINEQFGTKYCYITPCNLFGIHDKFDERSHFVADLIQKIHNAKINNSSKIVLYGTGTPLRQYMNAKDLAKILKLMIDNDIVDNFNVATDENLTIEEITLIALDALGCKHFKIEYDNTKPDGQYRKDVDNTKFKLLFPDFKFSNLKQSIKEVYEQNFTSF
jgi:GDP-L-fucose synthase